MEWDTSTSQIHAVDKTQCRRIIYAKHDVGGGPLGEGQIFSRDTCSPRRVTTDMAIIIIIIFDSDFYVVCEEPCVSIYTLYISAVIVFG